MTQSQPVKTYRGTWDELMRHRSEFAPDAVLEVTVYAPETTSTVDPENQALIDLLRSWQKEDATDDPEELERRDAETHALLSNLQANRFTLSEPEA